jgi:hypothetical protein
MYSKVGVCELDLGVATRCCYSILVCAFSEETDHHGNRGVENGFDIGA